jgi:hypothetical protein
MKEVNESFVLEARKDENSKIIMLYGFANCNFCEISKETLMSVEEEFPEIEFVSYTITDPTQIPVFCPHAAPALLVFIGGYKIFEFHTTIETKIQIREIINAILS